MSTKKWIALVILIVTLIVALAAAYVIAREDIYQTDRTPVSTTDPEPTAMPESPEEPEPSLVACVGGETDETFRSAVNAVKDIDLLDAAMEQLSERLECIRLAMCLSFSSRRSWTCPGS